MKKKFLFPLAGMALLVGVALCSPPPSARADISPFSASGNLQAAATSSTCTATNTNITGALGACVQVQCPQGESTAVVNVANTAAITGTTTVYTATDINGSPGTFGAPMWSTAAGGTTNVSTITNSGKLYVTLGSDMWIEAVFTTATSGHGTATVTCSGAVARVGNIAIPTSGPASFTNLVCSGLASCSPSNGPTPAIFVPSPPPVLFSTTGQASPAPTGTPYLLVPCGTGSSGCSAGVVSVTSGVNNSGNGEWIGTVQMNMVGSSGTAENASGCVTASPAATILDGTRNGATACQFALTGLIFGSGAFANGSGASQNAQVFGHIIVPNSTTQTISCFVATSTAGAVTINTSCSLKLEPY